MNSETSENNSLTTETQHVAKKIKVSPNLKDDAKNYVAKSRSQIPANEDLSVCDPQKLLVAHKVVEEIKIKKPVKNKKSSAFALGSFTAESCIEDELPSSKNQNTSNILSGYDNSEFAHTDFVKLSSSSAKQNSKSSSAKRNNKSVKKKVTKKTGKVSDKDKIETVTSEQNEITLSSILGKEVDHDSALDTESQLTQTTTSTKKRSMNKVELSNTTLHDLLSQDIDVKRDVKRLNLEFNKNNNLFKIATGNKTSAASTQKICTSYKLDNVKNIKTTELKANKRASTSKGELPVAESTSLHTSGKRKKSLCNELLKNNEKISLLVRFVSPAKIKKELQDAADIENQYKASLIPKNIYGCKVALERITYPYVPLVSYSIEQLEAMKEEIYKRSLAKITCNMCGQHGSHLEVIQINDIPNIDDERITFAKLFNVLPFLIEKHPFLICKDCHVKATSLFNLYNYFLDKSATFRQRKVPTNEANFSLMSQLEKKPSLKTSQPQTNDVSALHCYETLNNVDVASTELPDTNVFVHQISDVVKTRHRSCKYQKSFLEDILETQIEELPEEPPPKKKKVSLHPKQTPLFRKAAGIASEASKRSRNLMKIVKSTSSTTENQRENRKDTEVGNFDDIVANPLVGHSIFGNTLDTPTDIDLQTDSNTNAVQTANETLEKSKTKSCTQKALNYFAWYNIAKDNKPYREVGTVVKRPSKRKKKATLPQSNPQTATTSAPYPEKDLSFSNANFYTENESLATEILPNIIKANWRQIGRSIQPSLSKGSSQLYSTSFMDNPGPSTSATNVFSESANDNQVTAVLINTNSIDNTTRKFRLTLNSAEENTSLVDLALQFAQKMKAEGTLTNDGEYVLLKKISRDTKKVNYFIVEKSKFENIQNLLSNNRNYYGYVELNGGNRANTDSNIAAGENGERAVTQPLLQVRTDLLCWENWEKQNADSLNASNLLTEPTSVSNRFEGPPPPTICTPQVNEHTYIRVRTDLQAQNEESQTVIPNKKAEPSTLIRVRTDLQDHPNVPLNTGVIAPQVVSNPVLARISPILNICETNAETQTFIRVRKDLQHSSTSQNQTPSILNQPNAVEAPERQSEFNADLENSAHSGDENSESQHVLDPRNGTPSLIRVRKDLQECSSYSSILEEALNATFNEANSLKTTEECISDCLANSISSSSSVDGASEDFMGRSATVLPQHSNSTAIDSNEQRLEDDVPKQSNALVTDDDEVLIGIDEENQISLLSEKENETYNNCIGNWSAKVKTVQKNSSQKKNALSEDSDSSGFTQHNESILSASADTQEKGSKVPSNDSPMEAREPIPIENCNRGSQSRTNNVLEYSKDIENERQYAANVEHAISNAPEPELLDIDAPNSNEVDDINIQTDDRMCDLLKDKAEEEEEVALIVIEDNEHNVSDSSEVFLIEDKDDEENEPILVEDNDNDGSPTVSNSAENENDDGSSLLEDEVDVDDVLVDESATEQMQIFQGVRLASELESLIETTPSASSSTENKTAHYSPFNSNRVKERLNFYSCPTCLGRFSAAALETHFIEMHVQKGSNSTTCPSCSLELQREDARALVWLVRDHVIAKHPFYNKWMEDGEGEYRCTQCQKQKCFENLTSLMAHEDFWHRYICKFCTYVTGFRLCMVGHLRNHTVKNLLNSISDEEKAISVVANKDFFKCYKCSKSFNNYEMYRAHSIAAICEYKASNVSQYHKKAIRELSDQIANL